MVELDRAESPDLRTRTWRQLDAALAYLETRPGLLEFINQEQGFSHSEEHRGQHLEGFEAFLRAVLAERGMETDAAGPWAHAMAGCFSMSVSWWLHERSIPRARFVDLIVGLLWDGLGSQLEGPPGKGPSGSS